MEYDITYYEVKSTNIVNVVALYEAMREWLIIEGYAGMSDSSFPEKYMWESRTQKGGREFWVWWRPSKKIRGNSFFLRMLDIDIHGVAIKDVEIMYEGRKIKASKGKVEIIVKAKLGVDRNNKWQQNKLLAPFFELFWKRIMWKEFEMNKKEILGDAYKLHKFLSDWFSLTEQG